jgi:hypothetical protein
MKSVIVTTAIVLCNAIPAIAGSNVQNTNEANLPITFTTTTCDGATVTVSGKFHVVNHDVTNANGEHLTSNLNSQGLKGTDTLGRSYVSSQILLATYEFTNGAYTQSGPFHFMLNGQGNAPNLSVSGNFHETIINPGTPDQKVTASVDNFKTDCH